MYKPDFRTVNDFRKNNIEELSGYFIDIVRMCKELGLISVGQMNIDGTKIKASAANRRTKTKEAYQKWLKRIDDRIQQILEEAEATDAREDQIYQDKRGDELPEEINTQVKLKAKIEKVMEKFKKEKEKINLTDPDARFMKDGRYRIDTSYNCQASLTKEQIMLSSEVITEASDRKALKLMVETSDANLAQPVEEIAADAGYSSYDNYEYLEDNNKIGYIPDQNLRKDLKDQDPYHHTQFHYDQDRDLFLCPEGKILRLYKIRRKDCGYRKFQTKIYKCKDCPSCLKKSLCTRQKYRTINREDRRELLVLKKSLCTRQKYRTINREDRRELLVQMRNRLQTETGRKKYLQRLWTTEPVFGHLKYNLGYRHFFLRSLKKVKGEFRLMCIGWNLKKMHKIMAFS
jgi:hypothetical protein